MFRVSPELSFGLNMGGENITTSVYHSYSLEAPGLKRFKTLLFFVLNNITNTTQKNKFVVT